MTDDNGLSDNELTSALALLYREEGPPTTLAREVARSHLTRAIDIELGIFEPGVLDPPTPRALSQRGFRSGGPGSWRWRWVTGQRRRRLLVAGAAVVCLALTIGVVVFPGSPARPMSAAAAVLQEAAHAAASAPSPLPSANQYLYVEETEVSSGGVQLGGPVGFFHYSEQQTEQIWVNPAGAGRVVWLPQTKLTWLTPGGAAAWAANRAAAKARCEQYSPGPNCQNMPASPGAQGPSRPDGFTYPFGGPLPYPKYSKLPTDPKALKRAIERTTSANEALGGAPVSTDTFFRIVGQDLQAGTSPAVRSAIYQMIEQLPGVTSLGKMTDALGRHGVGVAVGYVKADAAETQEQLIFDPSTSALLESRSVEVSVPSNAPQLFPPVGSVVQATIYRASRIVGSEFQSSGLKNTGYAAKLDLRAHVSGAPAGNQFTVQLELTSLTPPPVGEPSGFRSACQVLTEGRSGSVTCLAIAGAYAVRLDNEYSARFDQSGATTQLIGLTCTGAPRRLTLREAVTTYVNLECTPRPGGGT